MNENTDNTAFHLLGARKNLERYGVGYVGNHSFKIKQGENGEYYVAMESQGGRTSCAESYSTIELAQQHAMQLIKLEIEKQANEHNS